VADKVPQSGTLFVFAPVPSAAFAVSMTIPTTVPGIAFDDGLWPLPMGFERPSAACGVASA